ncbi:hypothetical protein D9M72_484110 [compost metagenome]
MRCGHCARPRPPSIQKITVCVARGSPRKIMRLPIDVSTKATATPASTRRSALVPRARETKATSTVASSAPPKAKSGTVRRPRIIPVWSSATIAPSAPPEETPSRCGSASGLRVTDCSTAPVSANPAPTSPASMTRGRRTSQTMLSRPADQKASTLPGASLLATIDQTVVTGIGAEPSDTPAVTVRRSSSNAANTPTPPRITRTGTTRETAAGPGDVSSASIGYRPSP